MESSRHFPYSCPRHVEICGTYSPIDCCPRLLRSTASSLASSPAVLDCCGRLRLLLRLSSLAMLDYCARSLLLLRSIAAVPAAALELRLRLPSLAYCSPDCCLRLTVALSVAVSRCYLPRLLLLSRDCCCCPALPSETLPHLCETSAPLRGPIRDICPVERDLIHVPLPCQAVLPS